MNISNKNDEKTSISSDNQDNPSTESTNTENESVDKVSDDKNNVNQDIYNWATLICLNGISIKSHGNANSIAFSHAIKQCFNFISNDLNKQIVSSIKNLWV